MNWRQPTFSQNDDHPVCVVSWGDTAQYCSWLSQQTRATAGLPTEAQWEYASRAGTTTKFCSGDRKEDMERIAWCYTNSKQMKTHPVGQKASNARGLYDIHGNLSEMVRDFFSDDYYRKSPVDDPPGPNAPSGSNAKVERLARGGGYGSNMAMCCSAGRKVLQDSAGSAGNGFRVVLDVSAALKAAKSTSAGK